MKAINKFEFLIVLATLQLLPNTGFCRDRPEKFAQDLGGNSVCNTANQADPSSRCPLRSTAAVSTLRKAPALPPSAAIKPVSEQIPAPSPIGERAPSAITQPK
jgi:hypothetical protein